MMKQCAGEVAKKKNISHIRVWVEKQQTLRERQLTGGVGASGLTSLRPTENSPQSQNLQGDFRQYSLARSVPYIMNTINLCGAVRVGSRLGESAGGSLCWTEID